MHYYSSLCVFVLSGYFLHIAATTGMYSLEDNSEHSDNQKYITLVNRFRRQVGTALSGLGSWITGSFGEQDLTFEKFQEESKRMGRKIITGEDDLIKNNPKLKPSQLSKILNAKFFENKEKYIKQQALNAKYKKPIPPGCHVEEGLEPVVGTPLPATGDQTKTGGPATVAPTEVPKRKKRDNATPQPSVPATPAPSPSNEPTAAPTPAAATAAPTTTTTTEIPLRVVCPTTITTTTTTTVKSADPGKAVTPAPGNPPPVTPAPGNPPPVTPAPGNPPPVTPAPENPPPVTPAKAT